MAVVENMSDIIGYAHTKVDRDGQSKRVLTLRSLDSSVRCGCRFRHIDPEIDFSYESLTRALNNAIDKEDANSSGAFVTEERQIAPPPKEYNYEALMAEFQELVGSLMNKNPSFYGPRITQIVDKYLGKGKKVSDATLDQVEFISLIIDEIKDEMK